MFISKVNTKHLAHLISVVVVGIAIFSGSLLTGNAAEKASKGVKEMIAGANKRSFFSPEGMDVSLVATANAPLALAVGFSWIVSESPRSLATREMRTPITLAVPGSLEWPVSIARGQCQSPATTRGQLIPR